MTSTPSPRVSVIVPVFRPGAGFDDLIASLDRQTLGPGEYELLLCDDGSGEPTAQRIAEVARTREYVRVLSLPHTGWPGTPRNHGIDAARGTYVFFADQDDWLYHDALEQMCDHADRWGSDVLIGRVVGVGRRIPGGIFRRDVAHAKLGKTPLLELLTPHKLFRTAFVRENGIRFPDGRVRLEDHQFVVPAYFAARTISILASVPCYAWVNNAGSASSSRIDPDTYFPHLETVLDIVDANVEPGPLRDRLLRHWYRGKILQRMEGKRLVRYPEEYRTRFLDVVTPLAQTRFGDGVEAGLAFPLKIRSALLRSGRRDDQVRFATFEAGLRCRADVTAAHWTRRGKLVLRMRVRILRDGHDALEFDPLPDADDSTTPVRWHPPADVVSAPPLPDSVLDARRDIASDRIDLDLRDADGAERRVARRAVPGLPPVTMTLDPVRVFARHDDSTGGRLVVHVRRAGWMFTARVHADPAMTERVGRSPLFAGRRIRLGVADDGTLVLHREWPAGRLRDTVAHAARPLAVALRRARAAVLRRRG